MSTRIGHVHLKVRNLEASAAFYSELLGFRVTEKLPGFAFLSGGSAHHELALQEVGLAAPSPAPGSVGLYHTAFEVDSEADLTAVQERLARHGVPASHVDHGISWATYFQDPDRNGVEIYLDRRGSPEGRVLWNGDTTSLARTPARTSE